MDDFDSVVHIISKYVIFIPLIILPLGLIFHFANNPDQKSKTPKAVVTTFQVPTRTSQVSSQSAQIDFESSQECNSEVNGNVIGAHIKNKKIQARIKDKNNSETTNVIVINGCGFIWSDKKTSGVKICNLSQLNLSSASGTLKSPPIDKIIPLMNLATKFDIGLLTLITSPRSFQEVLNSCKKQMIKDSLFNLPQGVNFEEVSL